MPDAKRYAESNQEEKEILLRHNSLLSSVLGEAEKYVPITTGYSDNDKPVQSYPQLEPLIGRSEHWLTVRLHEVDEETDPNYWHFFFSENFWTRQSADEVLKLVAEGVVSNVLFLSVNKNCIYHPYEGGADILVKSEALRNSLSKNTNYGCLVIPKVCETQAGTWSDLGRHLVIVNIEDEEPPVERLGPITYGKVPAGYKQIFPEQGEAPPLVKGERYNVRIATNNANGVDKFFVIRNGKVEVSDY